ncbi:MAG: arsenate reductase (glutaredoxin), partial [Rickettsiales bacterium]|nr:arsenate reductase (glutaredoxin) [Rickettsiales bacterium]
MSKLTILHNPRCSKSRQTLQLLIDNGQQPKVIEYLKNPPSVEELQAI